MDSRTENPTRMFLSSFCVLGLCWILISARFRRVGNGIVTPLKRSLSSLLATAGAGAISGAGSILVLVTASFAESFSLVDFDFEVNTNGPRNCLGTKSTVLLLVPVHVVASKLWMILCVELVLARVRMLILVRVANDDTGAAGSTITNPSNTRTRTRTRTRNSSAFGIIFLVLAQ
jgi:hypothetical protein